MKYIETLFTFIFDISLQLYAPCTLLLWFHHYTCDLLFQESAIDEVRGEVEELNQNKVPKRYIGDGEYAIYDVLGAGAFGCVYRVSYFTVVDFKKSLINQK